MHLPYSRCLGWNVKLHWFCLDCKINTRLLVLVHVKYFTCLWHFKCCTISLKIDDIIIKIARPKRFFIQQNGKYKSTEERFSYKVTIVAGFLPNKTLKSDTRRPEDQRHWPAELFFSSWVVCSSQRSTQRRHRRSKT